MKSIHVNRTIDIHYNDDMIFNVFYILFCLVLFCFESSRVENVIGDRVVVS